MNIRRSKIYLFEVGMIILMLEDKVYCLELYFVEMDIIMSIMVRNTWHLELLFIVILKKIQQETYLVELGKVILLIFQYPLLGAQY